MQSFNNVFLLVAMVSSAAFGDRLSGERRIVLPTVPSPSIPSNSNNTTTSNSTNTETYAALTWNYEFEYVVFNNVPILLETRTLNLSIKEECNTYLQKDSFNKTTGTKTRLCTKTKCGTTAAENQDCNNAYYLWDPTQMYKAKIGV